MKEAFEKIIEKLEEEVCYQQKCHDSVKGVNRTTITQARQKMKECYEHAIEIVKEVAEEYKSLPIESKSLTEKFNDGWIPVIRCKDCEYFIAGYPNQIHADGLCDCIDKLMQYEDYCSCAIKKGGDQ